MLVSSAEKKGLKRKDIGEDTSITKKLKSEQKTNPTILINPELEETIIIDVEKKASLGTRTHLIQSFCTELSSPDILSFTRCGQVPHVTQDLCSTDVMGSVQVVPLQSVISVGKVLKSADINLSRYLNTSTANLITPYDSLGCLDLTGFNDQLSVSIWCREGRRKVSNKEYLELIHVVQPEFFVCLADVVPSNVSKKRADKACYRTLSWITEAIAFLKDNPDIKSRALAVLPGSGNPQLMLKAANLLKDRDVYGFVIERASLASEHWSEIVKDTVSILPVDKPKFFMGARNPLEFVTAVSCGCHFVDSSFVTRYSDIGRAFITKPVDVSVIAASQSTCKNSKFGPSLLEAIEETKNENFKKKKDTGRIQIFSSTDVSFQGTINLKDLSYQQDFSPIEQQCGCFSCCRHTKGYINHLLLTNELLGPTLLQLHNLFYLRSLMKDINSNLVTVNSLNPLIQRVSTL